MFCCDDLVLLKYKSRNNTNRCIAMYLYFVQSVKSMLALRFLQSCLLGCVGFIYFVWDVVEMMITLTLTILYIKQTAILMV